MNNDHSKWTGRGKQSHHLVSEINVLKLTVDCLVMGLVDHTHRDERRAMIVDLYQEIAQWCDDKANGRRDIGWD